jgi:MYXO-CTERM domain-containing protein
MIIAAGEKAAAEGGYPKPAWLSAPTEPEPAAPTPEDEAEPEATCEGDTCTSVDATEPAAPTTIIRRTTTGCSAAPGRTSTGTLGGLALVALAAGALVRRRRAF